MTRDLSWLTARPIAHRGLHDSNKLVWENTLTAFSRAIDGNYAIECDVHLTKDGVPVIFHDGDLKRLTGETGKVHDRTSAEMQKLRIGGTKDHPPTLREMLNLIQGRVPLVIELKGDVGHDGDLVRSVAKELNGYVGHAAIMSFDHHLIRQCPEHATGIPLGLTAEGMSDKDIEAHFAMLAHGIDFVSYYIQHMPNRFISFVRERLNMPVISWTIRDDAAFKKSALEADQVTFEGIVV